VSLDSEVNQQKSFIFGAGRLAGVASLAQPSGTKDSFRIQSHLFVLSECTQQTPQTCPSRKSPRSYFDNFNRNLNPNIDGATPVFHNFLAAQQKFLSSVKGKYLKGKRKRVFFLL